MRGRRGLFGFTVVLAGAGMVAAVVISVHGQAGNAATGSRPWATKNLTGNVKLAGQVPLAVAPIPGAATRPAGYVRPHPASADIGLSFAFPLRDKAGLDRLIAQEARTHQFLTRAQIYSRFAPPAAQVDALRSWLVGRGFRVTHIGADRMAITAYAPTAVVEKTLAVTINDYLKPASTFGKLHVRPYQFYANTTAPTIPARFGVQSISGLSDVDRFFTSSQLAGYKVSDCSDDDNAVISPLCVDVRSGGYFPADLRGLYNVTGHGIDGTGQTIGFTLWTAGEKQSTMTAFATATGDQPITVDPNCVATGNSPTVPSSCTTQTVGPDHLLTILENGNLNNNFGSNVETALDIEAAHGVATHVGMKYYASDCATSTPPGSGLTNAGCNGSDVGLLEAIEDAANDPTLHSVSNSWAFGGEAEWGAADPFLVAAQNSFAIGAAAGTTFYFSTGDSGTYESGFPSDSQYVVAVGGTSTYSTSTPATYSTTATWSGGGSWCSNVIARPSWQAGSRRRGQRVVSGPRHPRRLGGLRSEHRRSLRQQHRHRHAERAGRRHEPRGARDERPAGPDPELRRRADVSGRDPGARLRGSCPLPARQRPQLLELLPRRRLRQHREPDERTRRRRRRCGLGRRDRLGRARLVQLQHWLRARARRDEPQRAPLARDRVRLELRQDAEQLVRAWVLVPVELELLRRRRSLGRNAVVRQVPHGRRVGRGEHLLQEQRRRPDLVPVEQRHVLHRLYERKHLY